jgi:hypothetical protein
MDILEKLEENNNKKPENDPYIYYITFPRVPWIMAIASSGASLSMILHFFFTML